MTDPDGSGSLFPSLPDPPRAAAVPSRDATDSDAAFARLNRPAAARDGKNAGARKSARRAGGDASHTGPDGGREGTEDDAGAPGDAGVNSGGGCQVALENALDKALTYLVPRALAGTIAVGQRVKVPLGRKNRPAFGYVVGVSPAGGGLPAGVAVGKLKKVLAIDDERVLIPPRVMELARWMSRYYVCPLGTVLETVIPSAVKKRIGLGYVTLARLAIARDALQSLVETTKQPKRRALYGRLLQLAEGESIELLKLASDAGVKLPTARKLATAGVITTRSVPDLTGMNDVSPDVHAPGMGHTLNDDQRAVLDALAPKLAGGFSTSLLMGVTGSGKTEVYLQAIARVLERGKQAIVLVPEIALTPQTVRRFLERFPRVCYLHSGLTATARHRQWQTILAGKADVVVGARSAIFAPVPELGIVVVDEEHESSYKQDQAPRYHARDLAIKRAQLEGCPVLLGSATPSLESYLRATTASASTGATPASTGATPASAVAPSSSPVANVGGGLLTLPRRVRGLSMPHVELVDMKQELKVKRQQHLISSRLEYLLRTTLDKGQQAILLLNRRGYSNFVFCASCQEPIKCKYCDVTLTYHRNLDAPPPSPGASASAGRAAGTQKAAYPDKVFTGGGTHRASLHTGQLHCHYCLAVQKLPEACPTCGKLLSLFGLGTQKVEEELLKKFPDLAGGNYARVDSDTMRSGRDYEELLARFGRGEVKVMLGTQMIAKGLDYPNVTLVGVISGDTALALPDFRAAERTFQLITQVAGRAGRGDNPGRVALQTFLPEDETIRSALKQDYVGFAARELALRQEIPLPPYARLARIVMRDADEARLQTLAAQITQGLLDAAEACGATAAGGGTTASGGGTTAAGGGTTAAGGGANEVQIKGPMPCAINRIAGYHRMSVHLSAPTAAAIQRVLLSAREAGLFKNADRVAVDIDPVSLL